MVRPTDTRFHIRYMRECLSGTSLRLALYIYEKTYLSGRKATASIGNDELAIELGCAERTIQHAAKQLRDGGLLRMSDEVLQAHTKSYQLYLPRVRVGNAARMVGAVKSFLRKQRRKHGKRKIKVFK